MQFLRRFLNFFTGLLSAAPRTWDVVFLMFLVVLLTFNPFYLNRSLDLIELGIYLPGINALGHGLFPYRDFFHLRGPLDIWFPAKLMQGLGPNLSWLCLYFYVGNVLCLMLVVLLAKELARSRCMLYMMIPTIIVTTFPRVFYFMWGGLRYALGILAVWMLVRGFRRLKVWWCFAAGMITVMASLMSIEIGVYVFLGMAVASILALVTKACERSWLWKAVMAYMGGCCLVAVPFVIYYAFHHALIPYMEMTLTLVFNMQKVLNGQMGQFYPSNFSEAMAAMVNPGNINFRYMTPSYLYLALFIYLAGRLKHKIFGMTEVSLVVLGTYGFIMYNNGFRSFWGHFEMALMPEKVLYFVLMEAALLWLWQRRPAFHQGYAYLIQILIAVLFLSSLGYVVARLNHRCFVVQFLTDKWEGRSIQRLKYFSKEPYTPLTLDRAKGIQMPTQQVQALEQDINFVTQYTQLDETVIFYPEMGAYNFLADRPFLGRFPTAAFAWFKESWHQEFVRDFKQNRVRYIFLSKLDDNRWWSYPPNRLRFKQTLQLIKQNYHCIAETPLSYIYERNNF